MNLILLIFFLVTGISIFYYIFILKNTSPASFITVVINDEGFFPDKVVISSGTTIRWINQGQHLHWPASNPHPAHNLYPKKGGCVGSLLDACHGLKNGEEYYFRFNALGVWGVHDHLFPGNVMSVEVAEGLSSEKSAILNVRETISNTEFKNLSYDKQLDTIKSMATKNPSSAWAFLKDNFMVSGKVVGNAHEFAHIIGNKAFDKLGLDGIKICDETFAFGCFHGVTEKMLIRDGLKDIKSIENGCLKIFPPDKSQDYTGCIHGIGHGVYSFEDGNMRSALLDCDIISEPYRQYCYDGVFMENSFMPQSMMVDNKNPWKFCTDLDEHYHRNCARYQSHIFLGTPGSMNSIDSVGKNCALGPTLLLRETCFESTGYYIAQNSLGKSADILKNCNKMPSIDGKEICIKGAAIETTYQRYEGFKDSSDQLCKEISEPRRATCLNIIKNLISQNVVKN